MQLSKSDRLLAENIGCGRTIFGITGTHGLPECIQSTGQDQCWTAHGVLISCAGPEGKGQDGYYQLGCEPTLLPYFGTEGYSRRWFDLVDCSEAVFTDNGDGTVTDHLTGLIWLKNANSFGGVPWEDALTICNTLAAGDLVGLEDGSVAGDWRLPNENELLSLVDRRVSDPALPQGHPFSGVYPTELHILWSSSTYAEEAIRAKVLSLRTGGIYATTKTLTLYVWPVRGGQ